jgi:hypothetical protein
MEHAIGTFRISTDPITVPICLFHKSLKAGGITFVYQQIARPLPAEDVTSGVPPRRALVGLVPGQKVKE